MSWFKTSRRSALVGLILALAGCGLQPVYGPGGAGARLYGHIAPADPQAVDDFSFVQRISERLGPSAEGTYRLKYQLYVGVVGQAITPDEVTTRYSLNGTADFTLTDAADMVLAKGRVSNFTSYSTTDTTIATLSAEADARRRLARMLADQVVTRLLATLP